MNTAASPTVERLVADAASDLNSPEDAARVYLRLAETGGPAMAFAQLLEDRSADIDAARGWAEGTFFTAYLAEIDVWSEAA